MNKLGKVSVLSPISWVVPGGLIDCLFSQRKQKEIQAMKRHLTKIEDLGDSMEEALILDIKYSTIGLAQQWDQLHQLGMRMQHNLEQQIQAKYWFKPRAGNGPDGVGCWSLIRLGFRSLIKSTFRDGSFIYHINLSFLFHT